MAGAEPLRCAARWRVSCNFGGVIEFRTGRLEDETKVGVADPAVGEACVRRGGAAVGGCAAWNIGEIHRHAGEHAEALVKVPAHSGIDLVDAAVRVDGPLNSFEPCDPLLGVNLFSVSRCGLRLALRQD